MGLNRGKISRPRLGTQSTSDYEPQKDGTNYNRSGCAHLPPLDLEVARYMDTDVLKPRLEDCLNRQTTKLAPPANEVLVACWKL